MLFKRVNTGGVPALDSDTAQEIYGHFQNENSVKEVINMGYQRQHVIDTMAECRAMEQQAIAAMTQQNPPQNLNALRGFVSSDLLDKNTVVDDIILWCGGDPRQAPTFEDYQSMFEEPEV